MGVKKKNIEERKSLDINETYPDYVMGPGMHAEQTRPCKTQKQKIKSIFLEIALSGASEQNINITMTKEDEHKDESCL